MQQCAIDLLTGRRTDSETAVVLNIHRVTVTRWRLYSPAFRTALAARRDHVWRASADHMRAMSAKALDIRAEELDSKSNSGNRTSIALAVLEFARALPLVPTNPTDTADRQPADGDGPRATGQQSEDEPAVGASGDEGT